MKINAIEEHDIYFWTAKSVKVATDLQAQRKYRFAKFANPGRSYRSGAARSDRKTASARSASVSGCGSI
jgi:hypothetical protein